MLLWFQNVLGKTFICEYVKSAARDLYTPHINNKKHSSQPKGGFPNKVEAMHEMSLLNVKIESRSTSCLSSTLYILPLFYLRE